MIVSMLVILLGWSAVLIVSLIKSNYAFVPLSAFCIIISAIMVRREISKLRSRD